MTNEIIVPIGYCPTDSSRIDICADCPSGYFVAHDRLASSGKSQASFRASRLGKRGVSRSSRHAGWDAMDAMCRSACERGRTTWRGREIVWSWHPGADAKSAMRRARGRRGQECRSPGRARISVKTVARGRPVIWLNLWFCRVLLLHADHGYQSIPGLPCAFSISGAVVATTRA
jgi:hypothetical protein